MPAPRSGAIAPPDGTSGRPHLHRRRPHGPPCEPSSEAHPPQSRTLEGASRRVGHARLRHRRAARRQRAISIRAWHETRVGLPRPPLLDRREGRARPPRSSRRAVRAGRRGSSTTIRPRADDDEAGYRLGAARLQRRASTSRCGTRKARCTPSRWCRSPRPEAAPGRSGHGGAARAASPASPASPLRRRDAPSAGQHRGGTRMIVPHGPRQPERRKAAHRASMPRTRASGRDLRRRAATRHRRKGLQRRRPVRGTQLQTSRRALRQDHRHPVNHHGATWIRSLAKASRRAAASAGRIGGRRASAFGGIYDPQARHVPDARVNPALEACARRC